MGSDFQPGHDANAYQRVSIHAPRVGSDSDDWSVSPVSTGFNPRSPCGERRKRAVLFASHGSFNPRSPCGERPLKTNVAIGDNCFNPRSPCGERPPTWTNSKISAVSIHAPRVGSDTRFASATSRTDGFQSTLPVWGATTIRGRSVFAEAFQSTLPVWGATRVFCASMADVFEFQSTLPVWGATPVGTPFLVGGWFQSTLPVWGATLRSKRFGLHPTRFNPRSPCGERPEDQANADKRIPVSIHAPRVGSDLDELGRPTKWCFNPRSPCGERLGNFNTYFWTVGFQSTLPVWGATRFLSGLSRRSLCFNPRSPCGERRGYGGPDI